MARSNGNQDRTGAQPGRPARPAAPVDHGLPWNNSAASGGAPAGMYPPDPQFAAHDYDAAPTGRPQAGPASAQLPWPQQMQQPTAQPPQYAQPPYPPQGHPQQAYAQPTYPQQSHPSPNYAADPHNGHYFPPATADSRSGYAEAPAYQDPASHLRGSYPAHGDNGYPPAALGQPTGQYPTHSNPYQTAQPAQQSAHDQHMYELGAYATPPAGYPDAATGRGYPQPPQAQPQFQPRFAEQHAAPDDEEFDEDAEYEDEDVDPPRRFGIFKIIASLTVAIALGAGGAYGYKKYASTSVSASGKPIVVRADAGPVKIRTGDASPVNGSDTKAGERVGDQVPAVVPANDGAVDGTAPAGARRVQTIAIAPPGTSVSPPQPLRPTISVPGLALDGFAAGPAQTNQAAPPSALPPVTPAPAGRAVALPPSGQRAPVTPRVIASAEDPATAAKAATPQRVAVLKAAPKAPKASDAYSPGGAPSPAGAATATVATAATTPAPAAKVATNGYVAVLSSQGTAIDARKSLDDLQGKYTDVLSGKPTDVTEFANPKDGKTYYRAIVGPPGSREAAANICSQIKAAGHKDCFATAY